MASRSAEEQTNSIVADYIYDSRRAIEGHDLSLYQSTDRYGFIHTSPVQQKLSEKDMKIESERSLKWSEILSEWQKYTTSDKLHKQINKGIPNSVRGEVWKRLLDIENVKHPRVYEEMKALGCQTCHRDIKCINLDIPRTFPNHIMYQERYSTKQQSLFHVLVAYSAYNPECGYVSGMSFIAGLLLMYLNEEDAFWAMVVLIGSKKYGMYGIITAHRPNLLAYFDLHEQGRRPTLDFPRGCSIYILWHVVCVMLH